ncbi:MAG: protein kinase [Dehalococcoidia bacterium]|nr:protein kinase [Dehalococcoidia bacterium]
MNNCPNCNNPYETGDEVCRTCGFILPLSTAVIPAGEILQTRYEIQDLVHSGGMGYVYLATDKRLYDRLCIVKQIKEPIKSDVHRKKLEEEALRMAKLDHPNVAMILDHFIDGGYYFLVVERIHGKTLSEVFKEHRGRLTEDEVLSWAISICDVVSYLHKEGVVHRDISPDNIMLTGEGSIKFIDFGTLRELRYIVPGGTAGMGKYGYTPPEQWQGKPEFRSDIFALGATIYYLLTGFLPLSREYLTRQTPQRDDFNPSFPPIRTKNPSVSPQLEVALQKALRLDVNDRYSSVAEFGEALKNLARIEIKKKPTLSLETRQLDFANVAHRTTVTKPLILRNTGTGRLTGALTTTQPWLKVSPNKINLKSGSWIGKVTVNTRHLESGFNGSGEIDIATNAGLAQVTVALSLAKEARPKPAVKPKPVVRPKDGMPLRWSLISMGIILFLAASIGGIYFAKSHLSILPTSAPALAIQSVSVATVTDTGAVLAWATNKPAISQVEYGITAELGSITAMGQELVVGHSIELTGLQPNTTYYFKVISKDAGGKEAISNTGHLTTLPAVAQPVTPPSPISQQPAELSFKAKTYTNDKYGFSFQYPAYWIKDETILTSPYHLAAFRVEGNNLPGVSALAFDADAPESNDWIIKSFGLINDTNIKVVTPLTEETLPDGTKAYTYKADYIHTSGTEVTAYILDADKDGKRIRLDVFTVPGTAQYDEKLFSEIAHTLRFTSNN